MKPSKFLFPALVSFLALPAVAQNAPSNAAARTPLAATASTSVPALVPYSGAALDSKGQPLTGDTAATFLIYKDELGGEPLFVETQTVALDSTGHYKAQLGATLANGIPMDLFATGEARWLEVQIGGEKPQPRVLLASVPYALKAADAATLGGLPASAFALAGAGGSANSLVTPDTAALAASNVTTTGGAANDLAKFSGTSSIVDSLVFDTGVHVGINTATPSALLDVNGTSFFRGSMSLMRTGNATSGQAFGSNPLNFYAQGYNSSTHLIVNPGFLLEAVPTGNNTPLPGATLNVLYSNGGAPARTGLFVNANGTLNFVPGQTFPGTGSDGANIFAGNQFINGTGAAGNYGLTVNQPSQTGVLVESGSTGVGAGLDLQTTGSGGKHWEILATGNSASQGPGKFNIRDINTGTDVFTVSSTDAVTIGGALTLQENLTDSKTFLTSSNVIGGWSGNTVTNSATGATIAGGGESTADGGPNIVSADFGTVGGGENNTASGEVSTVAGGYANTASGFGSMVAGGINTASGSTSTVPGGYSNLASGDISFAAGFVAHATDSGSFVWCQQDGHLCSSSGTNSFVVSVNGPIYFYDGPNGQGCYLSAGSGSWTCSSDRNLKENLFPLTRGRCWIAWPRCRFRNGA